MNAQNHLIMDFTSIFACLSSDENLILFLSRRKQLKCFSRLWSYVIAPFQFSVIERAQSLQIRTLAFVTASKARKSDSGNVVPDIQHARTSFAHPRSFFMIYNCVAAFHALSLLDRRKILTISGF